METAITKKLPTSVKLQLTNTLSNDSLLPVKINLEMKAVHVSLKKVWSLFAICPLCKASHDPKPSSCHELFPFANHNLAIKGLSGDPGLPEEKFSIMIKVLQFSCNSCLIS